MSSFWSADALTLEDALNDSIWAHSSQVQNEIQSPADAKASAVGAQQAMLMAGRVLPWVPDILGLNWERQDSLLIIGSAYAPFVEGSATRSNAMSLTAYLQANSWQEFQSTFIESVVKKTQAINVQSQRSPPGPGSATTALNSLFDLCRVSFVERQSGGAFKGGDAVVGRPAPVFERYVEHPQNEAGYSPPHRDDGDTHRCVGR